MTALSGGGSLDTLLAAARAAAPGVDFEQGVTIVPLGALAGAATDLRLPLIVTRGGAEVAPLPGRSSVGVQLLIRLYGADFDAVAAEAANEIDGLTVDRPGFVVRYAINPQLSAMVWKLGDGEVSGVETLGDQLAIIRVNAIETKPYTEEQRSAVEASGFDIWLDGYRSTAKVVIDGAVVQEAGESPAP